MWKLALTYLVVVVQPAQHAEPQPSAATGEAVTQQGLDTRCELWLDQVFGLKLDFAIENSLPVCLEDGVIERDAQVSKPFDSALCLNSDHLRPWPTSMFSAVQCCCCF